MFRMVYFFVALGMLFFLPGVSLIMFFLWICKMILSSFAGLVTPAPKTEADKDEVADHGVSPELSQQEAAAFEKQARLLDEEREGDELLAQNAATQDDALNSPEEEHEAAISWQDRLEDGYRPRI